MSPVGFQSKGGDLRTLFFISTKLIQNIDKHIRPKSLDVTMQVKENKDF